jgi:hypothetical protein
MPVEKYNIIIIPYEDIGEDFNFDEEPLADELFEMEAIGYTADGKYVLVKVVPLENSWEFFTDVPLEKQIENSYGVKLHDIYDINGNSFDSEDCVWQENCWVYLYDTKQYWEKLCAMDSVQHIDI